MKWLRNFEVVKLTAAVLWLGFSVVFALWWFKFSLSTVTTLSELQPQLAKHWGRARNMLFWEGLSWIVLLALGGGALIALVQRERWRMRRINEFFASFSHEVKTSLTSLRIQAEALKEEAQGEAPILDRLVGDTVRLELQLENSLFLASKDELHLFIQTLNLQELLEPMREQWPSLRIELKQNGVVHGDARAVRTILSNLLQNAVVHGGATEITVEIAARGAKRLTITLADNGRGFHGSRQQLGRLFYRPQASSGSGLGLHICRLLLRQMHGQLEFVPADKGFHARFEMPGVLA